MVAKNPGKARGTVAFDIIGTCFSLQAARDRLAALGAPPVAFDLWFTQSLRDAAALSLAGGYRPLMDVLAAGLPRTLRMLGSDVPPGAAASVLATFGELTPQPGLKDACEMLADGGWRLMALTNSSREATQRLLARAGLLPLFAGVRSADEVQKVKPHPAVYNLLRGEAAGELWMVAAHAWDIVGALRAGMRTAWISGLEREYLAIYPQPDVMAADLVAAASSIEVGRHATIT